MKPTVRSFAILAVAVLASAALSGCLGPAKGTVKREEGKAHDWARDHWSKNASYVGAFGMEGHSETIDEFDYTPWPSGDAQVGQLFARAKNDSNVGDGKAEAWAFGFISDEKPHQILVVFVDRGGKIVANLTFPRDPDLPIYNAIGKYKINSDKALSIAKKNDKNLSKGLEMPDRVVFVVLIRLNPIQAPMWFIAGGGGELGEGVESDDFVGGFAVVDAITGRIWCTSDRCFFLDGF